VVIGELWVQSGSADATFDTHPVAGRSVLVNGCPLSKGLAAASKMIIRCVWSERAVLGYCNSMLVLLQVCIC